LEITGVETTTVAVPFVPRMEVLNADLAKIPKVIIKVFTDEGLMGVGESYRGISEETVREHSSKIIGKNPLDLNLQELGLPAVLDHVFEQAICDLAGKALKVPVYKLLGGAYRMEVPVSAWSPHHGSRSPEKTAAIAELAAEMGYKVIKLKARSWDIIETVEAIEKAVGPDMGIVCDPNTQFEHLSTAVKLAKKLDKYNIVCFEDPIRKENLRSYVLLRQKIDIQIALHIVGVDIINAVKMEACDIINTGGTMYEFKKNATIAELDGIPVWHGSGVDLGILEVSYIHACAATKNAVLTSDIFGEFCREDDILIEPLKIENGLAKVPNRPGLGVEIDDKALAKYKVK